MTVTLHADPVPLRVDDTGTIRVAKTRISLDVLLADFRSGMTPEEIVEQLDTLNLADVYGAIAYYRRHQEEVDEYLKDRKTKADELRRMIEANQPKGPTKAELLARLAKRNGGHAPDA